MKENELHKNAEKWLWSEGKLHKAPLIAGAVAMLVSSYSNQAVPRMMGRLMDPKTGKAESGESLFSSILALGIVGGIASFTRTVMLNHAKESIAANLRRKTFASLLKNRELEWFFGNDNGDFEETGKDDSTDDSNQTSDIKKSVHGMTPSAVGVILKDDAEIAADTVTLTVANIMRSASSCIFGAYHMSTLNPNLFGLSLVVAPMVGTLALLTRKYLKRVLVFQQKASLTAASFIEDKLSHLMIVKLSNREKDEIESYERIQDEIVTLGKKSAIANGVSMGTMFALSTSALCGVLLVGGKAVEQKRMTHGELVSFGSSSFLLALGSAGLARALGEYRKGIQCAARLYSLFHTTSSSEILNEKPGKNISFNPKDATEIRLEKVTFEFRSKPSTPILKDISLSLSRGEVLAVVGKNGAGKTSLATVLSGLYRPTSGRVVVNAGSATLDIGRDLAREARAKLVHVLPQSPALFNTTILENVRYSIPGASLDDVAEAMRAAKCDDFVSKLEEGLYYQVGRNGCKLSGGQRQRIALARALLADPVFLVLDEPLSSLDHEGEEAVVDAVNECRRRNLSLLMITHSPKTLSHADRVIVLDNGEVAEEGKLSDLLKSKNGRLLSLMPDLRSM